MESGNWTWLEVAKLVAQVLTPAAIALLGVYIHRVTKRFEHKQWRGQKLIEKRLAIYDSLAPHLNDVLCYFTYVGAWKESTPAEIVALKRKIDKQMHLAAPLFSDDWLHAINKFQSTCFKTFTGWGRDAELRTEMLPHYQHYTGSCQWQDSWDSLFSEDLSEPDDVRDAYAKAMNAFSKDIGVQDKVN